MFWDAMLLITLWLVARAAWHVGSYYRDLRSGTITAWVVDDADDD